MLAAFQFGVVVIVIRHRREAPRRRRRGGVWVAVMGRRRRDVREDGSDGRGMRAGERTGRLRLVSSAHGGRPVVRAVDIVG